MRTNLELLVPPPLLFLATALLMWLVAVFTTFARIDIPARSIVGTTAFVLGVLIDVTGFLQFRRARTTINPMKIDTTSSLVTTGLYRLSRNPMYVGQVLVLFAWGVYLQNVVAFTLILVFIVWIDRFQIVPEERVLQAKFGRAFSAYKENVRRWL